MLDSLVSSYGINSSIIENKYQYHIYIIGKNGIKLFFYESGTWGEDINQRAETDDFIFAYEQLSSMLDSEDMRNKIEANLLF